MQRVEVIYADFRVCSPALIIQRTTQLIRIVYGQLLKREVSQGKQIVIECKGGKYTNGKKKL